MATVYIGIGSNLGSREENCDHAIKLLIKSGVKVLGTSSKIETAAWGITDQPDFINMAIMAQTDLKPLQLLHLLKNIETELGRQPAIRWGPRTIDLDILLYEDQIINTPELEIPHPRMCDREFVLGPLAEIGPDVIHPVFRKSIKELLKRQQIIVQVRDLN